MARQGRGDSEGIIWVRKCLEGAPCLSWRWLGGGALTPDGSWGTGCRISAASPYCWPGTPTRDAVQAKPLQGWLQPPAAPTRPTKRVRPCTCTPSPQNTGAQTLGGPRDTHLSAHISSPKTTMQPPLHAVPVGCVPGRNKDRLCFTSHKGAGSSPNITQPAKWNLVFSPPGPGLCKGWSQS